MKRQAIIQFAENYTELTSWLCAQKTVFNGLDFGRESATINTGNPPTPLMVIPYSPDLGFRILSDMLFR